MAQEETGGSSVISTASDVTKSLSDAKDTAKAVAKAAKQSGGNMAGFAAAMAKELIKDPELARKVLRTALIAVLAPFLIIVLVIVGFGAAVLAFIQQVITDVANYIIENNGSWGNVDWDYTIGFVVAGGNAIHDALLGDSTETDPATGTSYQLDDGIEVQDEMEIASSSASAGRVLQKRIAMIKRSAVARKLQYQILFNGLCTGQAIVEGLWALVCRFFDDPDLMLLEDVTIYDDMTEVSDLDAAALLCAYSVQKDVSFQDIKLLDLRYWIGHYSGIGSLVGLNERVKPRSADDPDYTYYNDVTASSDDGSFSEIISLNTDWIRVPKWFGTFVPQYVLEQVRQDADMDEKIENGLATPEEIASGMGYDHSSRGTPSYPEGHGIIDDLIVLETHPVLMISGETMTIREYFTDGDGSLTVDSLEDLVTALKMAGAYGVDAFIEGVDALLEQLGNDLAHAANTFLGWFGVDPIFDEGIPEVTWTAFWEYLNGRTLTYDKANLVVSWFGGIGNFRQGTSVTWPMVVNKLSNSSLQGFSINDFLRSIGENAAFDDGATDITWNQVYNHLCTITMLATTANQLLQRMGLAAAFNESNDVDWTRVLDEIGNITVVSAQLHIPLKVNHYEEIATNVIGLWKGPLEQHDTSTLINRPFANPEHPNLLKYQWTDNRGVTYTRMRGYQYENFIDSLEALSREYGYGFTRPQYSTGGQAMADKAMEEYALYGGQSVSVVAPRYWSIYYGAPCSSTAAWCCCFVFSCAIMLDQEIGEGTHLYEGEDSALGPRTGWCETLWNYLSPQGRAHHEQSYIPQPGDVIFFGVTGQGSGGIAHVGIVISVDPDGKLHTVEGNSGDTLKNNTYSSYEIGTYTWTDNKGRPVSIFGYGAPNYPDSANANDVRVFYIAARTPMTVHSSNGAKTYGRVNASISVVSQMMNEVFAVKYADYYSRLGGGSLSVGSSEFDAAWNELSNTDTEGFHAAVFDAYYQVCAKDFFTKLRGSLNLNVSSHRALQDLAWCAITRDNPTKAYNTFAVCLLDSQTHTPKNMTPREIIEAYYRERKSNLDREIPNEAARQSFIAVLDAERTLLLQELGPND